jgi:hypothetical protein
MALQEQVNGGLANLTSYDELSFSLDDLQSDMINVNRTEQRSSTASLNAFKSSHQPNSNNSDDDDDDDDELNQQDDHYHQLDSESSGTDMSFD